MNIEHTYSRELAELADNIVDGEGRTPRAASEIVHHTAPKQEGESVNTEKTYNFKTLAIVAVIAFVLGWSAFWLFGNRSGRFQSVKYGDTPFVLDTRTGEVFNMHGNSMRWKK